MTIELKIEINDKTILNLTKEPKTPALAPTTQPCHHEPARDKTAEHRRAALNYGFANSYISPTSGAQCAHYAEYERLCTNLLHRIALLVIMKIYSACYPYSEIVLFAFLNRLQ